VAASFLEVEHDLRKLAGTDLSSRFLLTDIVILAEDTPQIAPCEKNCPASLPAAKAVLFSEVWAIACHSCVASRLADFGLVLQAIDLTIPRADFAGFQTRQGFVDSSLKFAGFVQGDVLGRLA
jgi:hypothetical protein